MLIDPIVKYEIFHSVNYSLYISIFRYPFEDANFARGAENLFFPRPIRNIGSREEMPIRILRATEAGR